MSDEHTHKYFLEPSLVESLFHQECCLQLSVVLVRHYVHLHYVKCSKNIKIFSRMFLRVFEEFLMSIVNLLTSWLKFLVELYRGVQSTVFTTVFVKQPLFTYLFIYLFSIYLTLTITLHFWHLEMRLASHEE